MSSSDTNGEMLSDDAGDDVGREVGRRAFAAEINNAKVSFKEEDREQAPHYYLLPTGQKANRVLFVGTLTGVEERGDSYRGKVIDRSGDDGGAEAIFTYANMEFQPEAYSTLKEMDTPQYVFIEGKPRTFSPDDSDEKYVSLRPERIQTVSADVRDQWVTETAQATLNRIKHARANPDDKYVAYAQKHYGEEDGAQYDPDYSLELYEKRALAALREILAEDE